MIINWGSRASHIKLQPCALMSYKSFCQDGWYNLVTLYKMLLISLNRFKQQ